MAVSIRLSRIGKKHVPFFRIVVMDSRKKVTGAFLANLGTYDALNTKLVQFDLEGIEAWEKKGAIPSDTVKKLKKLYKDQLAGKLKPKDKSKGIMAAPKKVAPKPVEEVSVEAAAPAKAEEAPAKAKVEAPKAAEPTKEAAPAEKAKTEEKTAEKPAKEEAEKPAKEASKK